MKKEIKTFKTVCDCCETVLENTSYISTEHLDICYECAGKIFERNVIQKVPFKTLETWVAVERVKNSPEVFERINRELLAEVTLPKGGVIMNEDSDIIEPKTLDDIELSKKLEDL